MITIRFERRSALDQLADALRRADAKWRGGELSPWEELPAGERQEWRDVARGAATAVYAEITETEIA